MYIRLYNSVGILSGKWVFFVRSDRERPETLVDLYKKALLTWDSIISEEEDDWSLKKVKKKLL